MRLGRIPWINCYPVYGAMDRGVVPRPAELVSGTAAELNDLLAAGELDVSVVSAVEYARNAAAYHLLPDLAISCDGPVHSVSSFQRARWTSSDGATVLRTASSRTSVLLLELLCRHRWRVTPRFATVRAEATDLDALAGLPHEAVLVIGDAALLLAARGAYPVVVDLGRRGRNGPACPSSSRSGRPGARRIRRRCGGASRAAGSRGPGDWRTWTSWPRRRAATTGDPARDLPRLSRRPGLCACPTAISPA